RQSNRGPSRVGAFSIPKARGCLGPCQKVRTRKGEDSDCFHVSHLAASLAFLWHTSEGRQFSHRRVVLTTPHGTSRGQGGGLLLSPLAAITYFVWQISCR